jgi:hypothetical protein
MKQKRVIIVYQIRVEKYREAPKKLGKSRRLTNEGKYSRPKGYPVSMYDKAVKRVHEEYPFGRIKLVDDVEGGWDFYIEVYRNDEEIRIRSDQTSGLASGD